jgi:radical SAM superfamily enzyme YgiQ (UPF0313 family)
MSNVMTDICSVVLINPDVNIPSDKKGWRNVRGLPVRVGYSASVLKGRVENISIIDMKLHNLRSFTEKITSIKPDMVMVRAGLNVPAFSASTMPVVRRLIEEVKRISPGTRVVVSGPYPTIVEEKIVLDPAVGMYADFIIYGEEEALLPELIDYLRDGRDLGPLPGLSYKKDGIWKHNGGCRFVEHLDSLPWPAYDLMEISKYRTHTIISSRGCPFTCAFCATAKVAGKGERLRSVKDVVDEMEFLYRTYGPKILSFYDENFFFSRQRTLELCNEMLGRNLKFSWRVFEGGRVDKVDREILTALKKSGCLMIGFGLESADEAVLKNIDKKITADDVRRAAALMDEVGIKSNFFVTIGNPGDRKESVEKTIRLIKDIVPNYVMVNMIVPYPNTPLKEWAEKNGVVLSENYEDTFYTNDTYRVPRPSFETADFTAKERTALFRKAASVSIGLSELRPFLRRSWQYFSENKGYGADVPVQVYYFLYFRLKKLRRKFMKVRHVV